MAEYFQSADSGPLADAPDLTPVKAQPDAEGTGKGQWTYPPHAVGPCPKPFSDHVVKNVEGVDVPIRIFPAQGGEGKRSWIFYVHGGGWSGGKHYTPNFWIVPAFRDLSKYHVVSVAYRLLPQATIHEQWSDVIDSFTWSLSNLPKILGEDTIDISSYAAGGDSAGGHLATLAAHKFTPKPKAVIDIFGVVDFTSLASVDEPRQLPSFIKGYGTSSEKLDEVLRDRDLSRAVVAVPYNWEMDEHSVQTLQDYWGYPIVPSEDDKIRMDLNLHYVRTGSRVRSLLNADQLTPEEYEREKRTWSPRHLLPAERGSGKNKDYPPTVFLHGTADDLVPVGQSKSFAEELRKRNVDTKEVYCEGGSHGFEQCVSSPNHRGWNEYILPVVDFVKIYLE